MPYNFRRLRGAFFCFLVLLFIAAPCRAELVDNTFLDTETFHQLRWMGSDAINLSRHAPLTIEESDGPAVFTELESREPELRIKAVYKLVYLSKHNKLGVREKEALPALRNLLKSEYKSVRRVAAMGLVSIDPSLAAELAPVFIETIQDNTQPELRMLAVLLCRDLRIKEAVPALIE
ncbi:MAG: HEAT repeat domain-containing protein, partial [Planctomycetota bacterium]